MAGLGADTRAADMVPDRAVSDTLWPVDDFESACQSNSGAMDFVGDLFGIRPCGQVQWTAAASYEDGNVQVPRQASFLDPAVATAVVSAT